MRSMGDVMKRGWGVSRSLSLGLAIFLIVSSVAEGADPGGPQIKLRARTPIQNGDWVTLSGWGFQPGETLTNFGAVAAIQNEDPPIYRGYNLTDLQARADGFGQFQVDVRLGMLTGVRGFAELALYYHNANLRTEFLPVADPGIYQPSGQDAMAGTLIFDSYSKGGPGEPHIVNGDDVPLSSNNQGDWEGTLMQVDLQRYTTMDATGTAYPVYEIANDVTFLSGNIVAGSSAITSGLSVTYKSIRMTVAVWDPPDYSTARASTTTGTTQGTNWLSAADQTGPEVSSANATSLTTIVVTFSEAVTTPSSNANAIDNWTITFGGNKAVSALSPLGSSGTTTVTLTVADLGDRGATPTVQFTAGTDEFEDESGNDCASTVPPHITATDGIAPATPTLSVPNASTIMEGASVDWSASAGSGTDNSLAGMEFQGSTNGTSWDSLGADGSSPYGGTYTFGTEYNYYRCQAYDTNNNTANSSSTENLHDAQHLHLTTIPASTQANVESGQWTVTVHDNYGNAEIVTQTVSLSTTSTWGAFRAASGGPSVTYINIIGNSFGNFYYIDTQAGNPWIYVVNVAFEDDSTQYTITPNSAVASIRIRSASGGGGTETGDMEIAGAPNGDEYNVTPWMYVAGYNSLGEFVTDVAADWSVNGTLTETGGSYFENEDPDISNRYIAITSTNRSGKIIAIYNGFTDSTGTVTVDATRPATVQGFNITEDQEHEYVNATWIPTSSYDDGNNPASGNVADFDVRFSPTIINSEAAWSSATTVGTAGKPASFNGSSSWRIYMAGFPPGYYFYAIKTRDPQGYWSNMGLGCYTTSPDYSLPVTLSAFSAAGSYGKIIVTWATESEVDALGFRLIRSDDATFSDALMVASYETDPELLCQGTSTTGFNYSYVDRNEIQPEVTYYYRLETVDVNGRTEASALQAAAAALPLPKDYSLGPNFPNPFNPLTQFEIRLPQSGLITVAIYDIRGREIARILDNAYLDADVYRLSWAGSDENGNAMPSGLYLCRLQAENAARTMKMMLIK